MGFDARSVMHARQRCAVLCAVGVAMGARCSPTPQRAAILKRMLANADQVLAQLLQLPTHVRARLAEFLIASLDEDAGVERSWHTEVARRVAELDAGTGRTRPLAEILRELRSATRPAE